MGGMACLLLGGCAQSVPDVPAGARAQPPLHAPRAPWFAQGRLELSYPGHFMSVTALVRHLADGHVRLVLISDEGLELLDLTSGEKQEQVTMALPELKRALTPLARLVHQAYGAPVESAAQWEGGHLVISAGAERRLYGGDPILLRAVSGAGLDLTLSDYRLLGCELVPLVVTGDAPFITITLRLDAQHLRLTPALTSK